MATTAHTTTAHLTGADIDEIGRELDQIRDEVIASRGEDDAAVHPPGHHRAALPGAGRPGPAVRLPPAAGLAGRHRDAGHRQDPGEHGDRPQRAARAVGLDARPRRSTPPPGNGTPPPPPSSGSTPTTSSTTPTPTCSARTATSATAPCGSAPSSRGTPCYLAQPIYNLVLAAFFEWGIAHLRRRARAAWRGEKSWRESLTASRRRPAQGTPPGGQGLRRVPAARRARLPARPAGQPHRERRPQPVGAHDHLLRPLPGRRRGLRRGAARGETRGEWYLRQLLGRPTSTAARFSTS